MVNEPPQPLPQTVCATLEHSGIPISAPENITDVPPLFDWMAQIQLYKDSFRFNVGHQPKDEIYQTFVLSHFVRPDGVISHYRDIPWNYIPFLASRWWTGSVSYKFIAIKPKEAVGKLLVRYLPDPNFDFDNDKNRRGICVEWDLALSSELEFDIPAYNPMEARPTWLPHVDKYFSASGKNWAWQFPPQPSWNFGHIAIECAQMYVPGNLFPDSTRILVFQVFKNANFYLPTDLRGMTRHCLATGADSVSYA